MLFTLRAFFSFALCATTLFVASSSVQAFPQAITYGYQSCLSCHYNPYGGGPLTDYGRTLGATEFSDRLLWPAEMAEEQIAERSAFFFAEPDQSWLRPSLSYRNLYLRSDYRGKNESGRYIFMDLSASVVAKMLERDALILVAQMGYAPESYALQGKNMRSREHYAGYRITKELGVYAGLMPTVFGLRIPDHVAFSRTSTGLTQYDGGDGILLHYTSKRGEMGVHGFVGNLSAPKASRRKGVSAQAELTLSDTARIGVSVLKAETEGLSSKAYATHARLGLGRGHSLLAELGEVRNYLRSFNDLSRSRYVFTQTHFLLRRGLWTFLTAEALKPDTTYNYSIVRFGPGLQWLPMQRVELRADALNTRYFDHGSKTGRWDLQSQVHFWF